MNRKTSNPCKTLVAGFLLAFASACTNFLDKNLLDAGAIMPQDGLVRLFIGLADDAGRSILPALPPAEELAVYHLYGTSSDAPEDEESWLAGWYSLDEAWAMLKPATWNFTLEAYLNETDEFPILVGRKKGVVITSGYTQTIQFEMKMNDNPATAGTALVYIALPEDSGVDSVETSIDGIVLNPPLEVQDDAVIFQDDDMAVGDHFILLTLKDNSGKPLVVIYEVLKIRGGAKSEKLIILSADDLNGPPVAPLNFRAAAWAGNILTFEWEDVSCNETGFVLNDGSTDYPVNAGTIMYTLPGVTAPVGMTFSLKAVNGFGESGNVQFVPVLPAAPTGLTAVPVSSAKVTVSWDAVADASHYTVYRSTSSDGSYAQVGGGVTAASYTDTGLTTGTPYYYKVAANNIFGEGMHPAYVSATPAFQTPLTPTGVTVIAESSTSTTMSWDAVDDAAGYRVYRSTTAGGTYTQVGGNISAVSYTNTGLSYGSTWYYKVSAYNTIGESAQSSYVGITLSSPATPTGVTGMPDSSSSITISWAAVAGATDYRIYRSTSYNGTYTQIGASITTTYTDTGLTGGYYYKVAAYNGIGGSSQSGYVFAAPLFILSDNIWQDGNLLLYGTQYCRFSVTAGNVYNVFWNDSNQGNSSKSLNIKVSAYYDGGLSIFSDVDGAYTTPENFTASISGYVWLRVVGWSSGNSGTYAVKYVQSVASPDGLTAAAASSDSITVSWNAVAGAAGYRIYRNTSVYGTFTQVGGNINAASYTDTVLNPQTTYYYKVTAYNANTESAQSPYVSAQIAPDAPTILMANSMISGGSVSITLSWDAIAGATGYNILRASTDYTYDYAVIGTSTTTSYTDTINVGFGAFYYYYRISAYNDFGTSEQSWPMFVSNY
jgi:fibronectin type 3 domain-containing protein